VVLPRGFVAKSGETVTLFGREMRRESDEAIQRCGFVAKGDE
jgi:hypothetical protein